MLKASFVPQKLSEVAIKRLGNASKLLFQAAL